MPKRQVESFDPGQRAAGKQALRDADALVLRLRRVINWNQRSYRSARSDHNAQALYRELGIDPFDAVLVDDERLGERFRQEGYRRWKADFDARRRRAERRRRARHARPTESLRTCLKTPDVGLASAAPSVGRTQEGLMQCH